MTRREGNRMKPNEIRGARTRLGYTQRYTAGRLGMSTSTYQSKENGVRPFTAPEIVSLVSVLHLTMEQANDFIFDGALPVGNGTAQTGNGIINRVPEATEV